MKIQFPINGLVNTSRTLGKCSKISTFQSDKITMQWK